MAAHYGIGHRWGQRTLRFMSSSCTPGSGLRGFGGFLPLTLLGQVSWKWGDSGSAHIAADATWEYGVKMIMILLVAKVSEDSGHCCKNKLLSLCYTVNQWKQCEFLLRKHVVVFNGSEPETVGVGVVVAGSTTVALDKRSTAEFFQTGARGGQSLSWALSTSASVLHKHKQWKQVRDYVIDWFLSVLSFGTVLGTGMWMWRVDVDINNTRADAPESWVNKGLLKQCDYKNSGSKGFCF